MQEIIEKAYTDKRTFFDHGKTRDYDFRKEQLVKLKATIKKYEEPILKALYDDLHKPKFEAFGSEVGFMYQEINHTLQHLKKWMKPKKVATPLAHFPSKSKVYSEPLGIVLVLAPWNYPFQLLMAPLVSAIAAGNCVVLKTANQTPETSNIIAKIIAETFDDNYVSTISLEDLQVIPDMIDKYRFDHIFFTGSTRVGKLIMSAAAKQLIPVTLELGGKSPCVVDKTANIEVAAKRIAWSKAYNAGQTCVAPDYVLAHSAIKDELVQKMGRYFDEILGDDPENSENFGHLIHDKHFESVTAFLKDGNIIYGGKTNAEKRFIQPTIMDKVKMDSAIMQEEIFGPILPIITWNTFEEAADVIRKNPYPLAFYVYANDEKLENRFIHSFPFGGGCINNGLAHLNNPNIPFGGVGSSGMGRYHSKEGFDTFSHKKSIMQTATWFDNKIKYAPYTETNYKLLKWFFR